MGGSEGGSEGVGRMAGSGEIGREWGDREGVGSGKNGRE